MRPAEPSGGVPEVAQTFTVDPEIDAMISRAASLVGSGDLNSAAICIEGALSLSPDSARAHRLAAVIRLGLNDEDAALDHFTLASHFDRKNWESSRGRVGLLQRRRDSARAIATLEDFLAVNPTHGDAAVALARLQYSQGAHETAAESLRKRLVVEPDDTASLNLLGLILAREFGDLDAGGRLLERALQLSPELDDAMANLGWVYAEQGRIGEALAHFNAVLAKHPEDSETRLMRAYVHLKAGEFAAGWADFDARHGSPLATPRKTSFKPCLRTEPFAGKRIFLRAEQGLGDQIMFVSCLQDLAGQGANCIVECDDRLVDLFKRSFPQAEVTSANQAEVAESPAVAYCEMPMGDLPTIFRSNRSDFPRHSGYLRADPQRVSYWRSRLATIGSGPVVGISWSGGAPSTRRQLRSIPLDRWQPLIAQSGRFVSLQYGNCAGEVEDFAHHTGLRIWHWPDVLADYDETAALVTAVDLVVSVCTAVVHLCGALGKEAWVLTPATPEWRYQSSGESMPWYPSVKLFRQATGQTWDPVMQRVSTSYTQRLLAH